MPRCRATVREPLSCDVPVAEDWKDVVFSPLVAVPLCRFRVGVVEFRVLKASFPFVPCGVLFGLSGCLEPDKPFLFLK